MASFSIFNVLLALTDGATRTVNSVKGRGRTKPTYSYSNASTVPAYTDSNGDKYAKISFPSSTPVTDEEMHRFADSLGHPRENAFKDETGFHIRVPA